jgi:hypothetical protein
VCSWNEIAFSPTGIRWICLGAAALLLAIATVILARFRVIQSRPLAACMVLSVFAHILLFVAAYFVEFFEVPEFSAGPAVSFRLVTDEQPSGELDEKHNSPEPQVTTPDESQIAPQADSELPAPTQTTELTETLAQEASIVPSDQEHQATPHRKEENTVAADLLPNIDVQEVPPEDLQPFPDDPGPVSETKPPNEITEEDAVAESTDPLPVDVNPAVSDDPFMQPGWAPNLVEDQWTPLANAATATDDAFRPSQSADAPGDSTATPSTLVHRFTSERLQLLQLHGGNADTERAVRDALRWLANHQAPDGRWVAGDHGAGTAGVVDFQERQGTGLTADTGVTALAILAMFGAGETATRGEYQRHLQRGLEFLCRSQASSGDLAGGADHFARMYCHGMSALALGEACSIHHQPEWEQALQRALDFSQACQHRATGGWRYRPGDLGDTSQFGWQVMALVSGQHAGLPIPQSTRLGMEQYLRSVSSGQSGGLASYRHFMPATPTMTAESLVCRLLLRPEVSPAADEAVRYILAHPPDDSVLNLYYCYYGSLALHLADAAWDSWNLRMQSAILQRQVRRGDQAGSWGLDTVWGRCGGRVYTTAMAALSLEVYYRYLPIVDRTLARR